MLGSGCVTHFRRMETPEAPDDNDTVDERKKPHNGIIDVQLVHSRDGRKWSRCSDRNPIIPLGPNRYDAGSIFGLCNAPVIVGDEMDVLHRGYHFPWRDAARKGIIHCLRRLAH